MFDLHSGRPGWMLAGELDGAASGIVARGVDLRDQRIHIRRKALEEKNFWFYYFSQTRKFRRDRENLTDVRAAARTVE